MSLKLIKTKIPDVLILEPQVFHDSRGYFMESFHQKKYSEIGIPSIFVQDNLSHSVQRTLRGLHYQLKNPQAKLIMVLQGTIFDVVVDIRLGSPTFGQWVGETLSDENKRQIYVPEGFAHGFCVLSEEAEVLYKCSRFYDPTDDRGILWSDPNLAIHWPINDPILSNKDKDHPTLEEAEGRELLPA